jgi:Flp pilus assembly protein CpaB
MDSSFAGRYAGKKFLSTKRGTMLVGGGAALLAGILLLVYVGRYRTSIESTAAPTPVLVAGAFVQKGTSAAVLARQNLLEPRTIAQEHVLAGAITDPSAIRGRVAIDNIYPGQQITDADFSPLKTGALNTQITGTERGVSVPVGSGSALIGHIQARDRVDIYYGLNVLGGSGAGRSVVKLLFPNVLVLGAPGYAQASGGGGTSNIVLRLQGADVARMLLATQEGTLFFVLRPRTGAKPIRPDLVGLPSLLTGTRSVRVGG